MNGTMLILLLIIACFGIAAGGCILWADDLEEIVKELKRMAMEALRGI